jgi:hypothetical protein
VRKKRKYITEDPIITLTKDDVELVTDKVQERGKKWYLLHRHKENISWPSTSNFMKIYNKYRAKKYL